MKTHVDSWEVERGEFKGKPAWDRNPAWGYYHLGGNTSDIITTTGPPPTDAEAKEFFSGKMWWMEPLGSAGQVFPAFTNESTATTSNMSTHVSVTEPDHRQDGGLYEIQNYRLRKDVVIYISYGPKHVDNLGGEVAMNLGRKASTVEFCIGQGDYRADTTVTDATDRSYEADAGKMFYNIGCAIVGFFQPEIGLFGTVFGSIMEFTAAIEKNDNPEPGQANSFVYLAHSLTDVDHTDRVAESQIDAVDSRDTVKPRSEEAYLTRRITVGEQLTLSIQINSNIKLEAKNTLKYPDPTKPGREYTTSGEYIFKNGYTLNNFKVCVPMGGSE